MIFVKDDFLSEPFELKRYLKDKKRNWYSDNSFSWPGERCYEIPEEIKNKILNTAISITQDKTLSLISVFMALSYSLTGINLLVSGCCIKCSPVT